MGYIMLLLHWTAFIVQILFLTVCVASGLFYLTELIEDYTQLSRKIFQWSNVAVIVTFVLLFLFEDISFIHTVLGLGMCASGYLVLQQFPTIEMLSWQFILMIAVMVCNHISAFLYFSDKYYSFSQIISYFTVCVWLVPLQMILGLVAGENVLPNMGNSGPTVSNPIGQPTSGYY